MTKRDDERREQEIPTGRVSRFFRMGRLSSTVSSSYLGQNNDQCPVSMVAGSTAEFASIRLAFEDYNDTASDPDDTPGFAYIWYGYCDPDPEDVDNLPVYP